MWWQMQWSRRAGGSSGVLHRHQGTPGHISARLSWTRPPGPSHVMWSRGAPGPLGRVPWGSPVPTPPCRIFLIFFMSLSTPSGLTAAKIAEHRGARYSRASVSLRTGPVCPWRRCSATRPSRHTRIPAGRPGTDARPRRCRSALSRLLSVAWPHTIALREKCCSWVGCLLASGRVCALATRSAARPRPSSPMGMFSGARAGAPRQRAPASLGDVSRSEPLEAPR